MAAFLVPIHLFLHGIAVPLGWVSADVTSYERMRALFGHPLVKIISLCSLRCLYTIGPIVSASPYTTWALKTFRTPIAILCYGAAVIGTVATIVILLLV